MRRIRTIAEMRSQVHEWQASGWTVGVVPTMGALHEGHLSLVDRSTQLCDRTIVSIFVNPIQFTGGEDFETYPRQEERDLAMLRARGGCDAVFSPPSQELFPDGAAGFATKVSVDALGDRLCGVHRPGHFTGVATQVLKLLSITTPEVAVFGEKDYQQLQVIKRMVRDLNIPVAIEPGPTVRERDGLAMSSRNAYLSPALRLKAPVLFRALTQASESIGNGADVDEALAAGIAAVRRGGFDSVDYFSLVDADTLAPLSRLDRPARLLAAARLGPARLIDNVAVDTPGPALVANIA